MKDLEKTLFITDLDGTLLTPEKEIPSKTIEILNRLMARGMQFSVATARSAASAVGLLRPLHITLPVVLMNGVVLYDLQQRRYLGIKSMPPKTVAWVLELLRSHGKTPFLYRMEDQEICVEYQRLDNPAEEDFYRERAGSAYKHFQRVNSLSECKSEAVYFTMIDTQALLEPIYQRLCGDGRTAASLYRDNYSDLWYLEIYSAQASKAAGARAVMNACGADRMVAFGDNLNDMEMLKAAHEGYAVRNALEALKEMATGVIGSNREEGVARFLEERFQNCTDLLK